jgi:hypothetical protein
MIISLYELQILIDLKEFASILLLKVRKITMISLFEGKNLVFRISINDSGYILSTT